MKSDMSRFITDLEGVEIIKKGNPSKTTIKHTWEENFEMKMILIEEMIEYIRKLEMKK